MFFPELTILLKGLFGFELKRRNLFLKNCSFSRWKGLRVLKAQLKESYHFMYFLVFFLLVLYGLTKNWCKKKIEIQIATYYNVTK